MADEDDRQTASQRRRDARESAACSAAAENVRFVNEWVKQHHAEDVAKAFAGLSHHDPEIRATWTKYIGDRTPGETWDLIGLMKMPPGKRGRPKGSGGFEAIDNQLLPEINTRIAAGEGVKRVTEDVACRLPAGGTIESRALRLARRRRKKISG